MKLKTVLSALVLALTLAACGPDTHGLAKGETGKIARANGAALELQNGPSSPLGVFLAEIGAPIESFAHKRVLARGPLGAFHDAPQLCLEQASALQLNAS